MVFIIFPKNIINETLAIIEILNLSIFLSDISFYRFFRNQIFMLSLNHEQYLSISPLVKITTRF